MNEKYKLVGFMNLLNIRPGFIYPIFQLNDKLYFQHGEKDRLIRFVEVNKCLYKNLIPLDNSSIEIDLQSNPIYAYQRLNKSVFYGNAAEMKDYLKKIRTQSSSLKKEIEMFFREVDEKDNNDEKIRVAAEKKLYGDKYARAGRFDEAKAAYYEAAELYKNINNEIKWAEVMKAVGDLLVKAGQCDDMALNAYHMAERVYIQEEKIYEHAGVYKAIGNLLQKAGKTREARSNYKAAENIYLKIYKQCRLKQDESALAIVLKDMGDLYGDLHEYDNAIKHYSNAEKIYDKRQDKYNQTLVQIAKYKILRRTYASIGADKKYIVKSKDLEKNKLDSAKLIVKQIDKSKELKGFKYERVKVAKTIDDYFAHEKKEHNQKRSGQKEDQDNNSKEDNRIVAYMDYK